MRRYSAKAIADWFLASVDRTAGDALTHLKLQKLVYYAQAWALVLLDRPLFEEEVQAWAHGPVVPSVWQAFREHGWEAIPPPDERPRVDGETQELLRDVLGTYGERSATALEALTHREDPWLLARGDLPPEARSAAVIPKEHMRSFYSALYQRLGDKS